MWSWSVVQVAVALVARESRKRLFQDRARQISFCLSVARYDYLHDDKNENVKTV